MTGDIQWTTATALTTKDFPGRRKKGSAFCKLVLVKFYEPRICAKIRAFIFAGSGWAHTFFFIDLTTGVAAVFATQLIPTADQETFKLYAEFEKTLYAALA